MAIPFASPQTSNYPKTNKFSHDLTVVALQLVTIVLH